MSGRAGGRIDDQAVQRLVVRYEVPGRAGEVRAGKGRQFEESVGGTAGAAIEGDAAQTGSGEVAHPGRQGAGRPAWRLGAKAVGEVAHPGEGGGIDAVAAVPLPARGVRVLA